MDVARALFRAMNDSSIDALANLYDPACVVEHVWADGHDVISGRDAVVARWTAELSAYGGALAGGHRVQVSRIAGIETGWGWVRADWTRALAGPDGTEHLATGYSHFWVENGLIRRHRSIAKKVATFPVDGASPQSERRYPTRPLVGVGAVIVSDEGEVLLVKRRHEPLAGQWSLPGGMLELGETLEAGVAREMLEETGLIVSVGPVVEVFDRILLDETGRVCFHFVLIDYLCRVRGGVLEAGSDVEAAAFVAPADIASYRITDKAASVIAAALGTGTTGHDG